jgi:predicted dehydrogenase
MTNVEDYDIHDSTVVSVRLKNGASGSIASSCVANRGGKMALDIFSPEASVKFTQGRLTVTENNTRTRIKPQVNVFEEESKTFIGAVADGKKNRVRSTYADALKTFLAACAASESMQSGMPVKP